MLLEAVGPGGRDKTPSLWAQSLACVLHGAGGPLRPGFVQCISGTSGSLPQGTPRKWEREAEHRLGCWGAPPTLHQASTASGKSQCCPGRVSPRRDTSRARRGEGPLALHPGRVAGGVHRNGNKSVPVERPPLPTARLSLIKRVVIKSAR